MMSIIGDQKWSHARYLAQVTLKTVERIIERMMTMNMIILPTPMMATKKTNIAF